MGTFRDESTAYKDDVYFFPKVPDERVAKLYIPAHGAVRTAITRKQAV